VTAAGPPPRRTRRRAALLGAAGALLAAPAALAQAPWPWPQGGPIRFVVPFPPGGTTDIVARLVAEEMARALGQTMLVENRPGAGATLGTGLVARAAPDGYTLLLTTISAMAVGQTLYRDRIAWDADRDFAHFAMLMGTPYLLLVNPRQPWRTLPEFVAAAKARPDGIAYGTSGVGSMPHPVALRLAAAAGIEITHVPYRGAAQAATDVIAGVLPALVDNLTAASANIRAGAQRALAHTYPDRVPGFEEIPTFRELGFPDLVVDGWAGLAAPAGTPRPVLERLAEAARAALASEAVRRRFADTATTAGRLFLDDAQRFVREEAAAWAPIVRQSGAAPD
jgi:tripartite-type tricarboxylate transporter receptor subunit TctC